LSPSDGLIALKYSPQRGCSGCNNAAFIIRGDFISLPERSLGKIDTG